MLFDPNRQLDAIGHQLMATADYIESHGWTRHTLESGPGGSVCLVGAFNRANDRSKGRRLSRAALKRLYPIVVNSSVPIEYPKLFRLGRWSRFLGTGVIIFWNDNDCKSQSHLVAKLRQAAFNR